MIETTDKIAVTVRDEGGERLVSLPVGETLLAGLQAANVPIGSVCGGQMSCGTCHVYLERQDPAVAGVDPDETALLEDVSAHRPDHSRLACQVLVVALMAGQTVEIASDA